jgi:hypothetical protein
MPAPIGPLWTFLSLNIRKYVILLLAFTVDVVEVVVVSSVKSEVL